MWFDLIFFTEKLAKPIGFLMGFFMVFYAIDFFKNKSQEIIARKTYPNSEY